jgi:hypothetical protein
VSANHADELRFSITRITGRAEKDRDLFRLAVVRPFAVSKDLGQFTQDLRGDPMGLRLGHMASLYESGQKIAIFAAGTSRSPALSES